MCLCIFLAFEVQDTAGLVTGEDRCSRLWRLSCDTRDLISRAKKLDDLQRRGTLRLNLQFLIWQEPARANAIGSPNSYSAGLEQVVIEEADAGYLIGHNFFCWICLYHSHPTPLTPPRDSSVTFISSALMALGFSFTHLRMCAFMAAVFRWQMSFPVWGSVKA